MYNVCTVYVYIPMNYTYYDILGTILIFYNILSLYYKVTEKLNILVRRKKYFILTKFVKFLTFINKRYTRKNKVIN